MRYDDVQKKFFWYLRHSLQGDEQTASEIYTEDAVVEFPQSGERFRGKEHFVPWRSEYPAVKIEFEVRAIRGEGDHWIVEGAVNYGDGPPMPFVDILHCRGGLIDRETIYITEAFPPDESRAKFAERSAREFAAGLPVRFTKK
ncbi:MAG: nuclear transport factor 2 family protein [Nakamurella sp.]